MSREADLRAADPGSPGPPLEADRRRLRALIRQLSLRRGRFVLASGAVSDYYLDLRLTTTHPEGGALAARFLLAEAARLGANRVGGPTLGADPLVGAAMALAPPASALRGFMVRGQAKDHGTGRQVEGHLAEGDRALVFDDVVTAGGSILKSIEAVRSCGARVVGTWCLVDRGQGGAAKLAEQDAPLRAVFQVGEILAEDPDANGSGAASTAGVTLEPADRRLPRTPVLAADVIVEPEPGRVLLVRRRNPPHGWALPGGFVEVGESLESAVRREALEETGLTLDRVVQMHAYSEPGRDPRFPTVSMIFVATARGTPVAGDDAEQVRLFPLAALPEDLCFDHRQILADYGAARFGLGPGWWRAD